MQAMAVEGSTLAWTRNDEIWAKRGADAPYKVALPIAVPVAPYMLVRDGVFYLAARETVTSCALTGAACQPTTTGVAENLIGPIVIQNTDLWFVNSNTGVWRCPLPYCANPQPMIALGGNAKAAVATTGALIYGVELAAQSGAIVKYVGVDASTIASDVQVLTGLATDGTNVYWSDAGKAAVRTAPVAGGDTRDLATGLAGPGQLAVDTGRLYWTEIDANRVMRCTLPDCKDAQKLADVKKPSFLGVGDRVYVASKVDEAILAVAK